MAVLQPCLPSIRALATSFPNDPGKADSTDHRTVEIALQRNQNTYCFEGSLSIMEQVVQMLCLIHPSAEGML